MQGFIILAIIGTEKLIVTEVDGRTDRLNDGRMDGNLIFYDKNLSSDFTFRNSYQPALIVI